MIDKKELRIGNKFLWGVNVVTIQGIHTQTIGNELSDENRPWHVYVSDAVQFSNYYCLHSYHLDPIPLDKEVLEACGFSERDLPDNFNGGNTGYEIPTMESADRWLLLTGKDGGTFFSMILENHNLYKSASTGMIHYLHQLQNLYFALTGNEINYKP